MHCIMYMYTYTVHVYTCMMYTIQQHCECIHVHVHSFEQMDKYLYTHMYPHTCTCIVDTVGAMEVSIPFALIFCRLHSIHVLFACSNSYMYMMKHMYT